MARWGSQITVHSVRRLLGVFSSKAAANDAYKAAEAEAAAAAQKEVEQEEPLRASKAGDRETEEAAAEEWADGGRLCMWMVAFGR